MPYLAHQASHTCALPPAPVSVWSAHFRPGRSRETHNSGGKLPHTANLEKLQGQYMTPQWIFPGDGLWLFNNIDVSQWISAVKRSRAFSSVLGTKTERLYFHI